MFQRLEKRNIDKLLVSFWQVMAPFEDVKIIEKNTELLEPSASQEEEEEEKKDEEDETLIETIGEDLTTEGSAA